MVSPRHVLAAVAVTASLGLSACAVEAPGVTQEAEDAGRAGAPVTDGLDEELVSLCTDTSSPTIKAILDRGTLNWGIGISPPFGFRQQDGSWGGVEADNAAELAAIMGVDVKIQDYDYGIMTAALQSKKADIVGAQLFITDERAESIGFSDPYYLSGQLFYVLESSDYQTIEDLNQPEVRFVYGTGNAQKDIAEKYIPKAKIFDAPLRGQLLLYEFLVNGSADVSMVEAAPMPLLKKQYADPQLAAIGMQGRVTTDTAGENDIIDPFEVAFGLPKTDEGWKACVDAWVKDASESGRMDERIQYWIGKENA